jgi:hypothetical protein
MAFSIQQCLDSARECEWMSSQAKDDAAKAAFLECAREWLKLAQQKLSQQKEALEPEGPKLP